MAILGRRCAFITSEHDVWATMKAGEAPSDRFAATSPIKGEENLGVLPLYGGAVGEAD
jgi:hypothetical protein